MSQSDRAIKKLATQLARLDREVKSWRGAQADYTSIENGGNFTFKDGDGNVTAIVGGQDDGSNTIRHVDGPVPPVPSGLTAHVDGPIVQVSWDGSFEDADEATYDWSHLEVVAVGPSNEQLTATINDVTGASVSLAATVSGEWAVYARSVSRAEKRSLDGDAGTVEVELTDLSGAIEDVQQSANGKNQVHYSTEPPTEADAGIVGDTWWVGMDGRPEEVLATNLATNPSFTSLNNQIGGGTMSASSGTAVIVTADWSESGDTALKVTPTASANATAVDQMTREDTATAADAGKTFTISANIHLESAQTGTLWSHPRRIVVRSRYGGFTSSSYAYSDSAPNEPGTHRVSVTFTLQPNTEWWYFMLTNGSSTVPVYWDSIIVEEGSGSGQYFDGDTPSGTSDNDPHYRWTGAPHASTSEQYLPEIGSGAWNIIEQYQYTPDGWTQVELSHEVIATVDLGKATVGELDGIRIMANTIGAETLTADAIDGKVITGATIRSAASGARTLMSTSGFEAYDNAGKRTFFASASTGSVSMTGELYTGAPGSERVVLDNSLWTSVQITDPDTGAVTNAPGAGVRIGVSSSSGADIYHAATTSSSGRYVDQAVLRGPFGRAWTAYGSVSAGGGLPASNYVTSTASDDSGKIAAEYRVTVGGIGSATRKVELIGSDTNGNSRALIRASGGNGKSNMWGLDENGVETSEVASDGANRAAWMRGADSSGASTASVGAYGNSGITSIAGSNQRPLSVNHTGGSDWWFVPFRKSGTEWGYVGSTGAMGVDEFGIQSAAGKNLVLRTTDYEDSVELLGAGGQFGIVRDGGAKVRSTTIAGVSGSPGTSGAPVYIRTSSGNMFISSSSRRYKTNITDARELPGLLDVSVRTWQDKADVELAERLKEFRKGTGEGPVPQSLADAEVDAPRNFGAVAEEVDELGLTELVRYDAYGRPDGLLYEMFGVALIPEIRKLRDRITELERQTR
jgi:hypothetical protein